MEPLRLLLSNAYKIQCVNSIISLKKLYFPSYYIHSYKLILDKQLKHHRNFENMFKKNLFINNENKEIDYEHVE
jgi:hypothetical protein